METDSSPKSSTGTVRKALKRAAVAVIFVGIWLLLLFITGQFIADPEAEDIWIPAITLVGVIPFTALAAIALGQAWFVGIAFLLCIVAMLAFGLDFYALASMGILFIAFWRSGARTEFELINNVRFSASRVLSRTASVLVLGYLLAVSVQVYGYIGEQINRDEQGFYDKISSVVTRSVLPIVEQQLPGFNRQSTLDQYLIFNFSSQNSPSQPQNLERDRSELLQRLGVNATGDEALADVTRRAISVKLQDLTKSYRPFLPLIYTIAIFSLLRVASFLITIAALLWGLLVFWLARAMRFLRMTTFQITAEKVEV